MTCFKRGLSAFVLTIFIFTQPVYAEPAPETLPTGYTPVSGASSYSASGNVGTLISNGPATVGNWDSFSIGSQSTFNAQIEGTHLSKVIGLSPSEIFGSLNVQSGQFFLVNPNGILFGPSSQVNAPGLVASTLNMLDDDFLAGRYEFNALTGSNGYLLNQGKIMAEQGGTVALIGRSVSNQGEIIAPGGGVVMAAGDEVTLSLDGSGLVSAAVTSPVQADVYDFAGNKIADTLSNTGIIQADGGYAVLTARSTENVFDNVINHSGAITANSIENKNGVITLTGGADQGVVRVSGDLQASGGEIDVTGNKVGVFKDASLDVSSETGDGGKIKVFAEDVALAYGSFNADAAASGGDGGFIETSGKNYLDTAGIRLSARAVEGAPGTWLLDPFSVTISTSATLYDPPSSGTFTPNASGANVQNSDITTLLNAGTAVTILTTGAGAELGNITVNAPIAKTAGGAATLTLSAAGNIFINESITSTAGALGVILTATAGNITIGNGADDTINANGGSVSLTAGGSINGDSASSPHISAGNISLTSGSGIGTSGVLNLTTPILTSATASAAGDISVHLLAGTTTLTSVTTFNGNIDVESTGNLLVGIVSAGIPSGSVGDVTLKTTAGYIRDEASVGDNLADINGDYVSVTSTTGIGEAIASGSLDVNSNTLDADTGSGGIFVNLLNDAGPVLAANHSTTAYLDATSIGNIVVTGTTGSGDRSILDAETHNGNITIGSGFGDLYVDDIYSDTGVVGTNDIVVNAGGASSDLIIGYIQSDHNITLTAPNGSIFDYDVDIQNLVASATATVSLSASGTPGDIGEIDNPIEHLSTIGTSGGAFNVNPAGGTGTSYLNPCDTFFCGSLDEDPFKDAESASYTSLFSDSFEDSSDESSDGLSEEGAFGDEGAGGEEESDDEGEKDEDKDAESSDGSTQTQTEQQKDIENDTPATENVTVSEQTFNPC